MEEENHILKVLESPNSMDTKETKEEKDEKKPLKRILTLDFLRGVAIFLMIPGHQLRSTYNIEWIIQSVGFGEKSGLVMFFASAYAILATFTSAFLIISIIVNIYTAEKRLERGEHPNNILRKQLITGFIIVVYGYLFEMILHPVGLLGKTVLLSGDNPVLYMLKRSFDFGTLHVIGWSIILVGLLHYFLVLRPKSKGKENYMRAFFIYAALVIVIIVISPFLSQAIFNNFEEFPGTHLSDRQFDWPPTGAGDFFLRQFLAFLVGQYMPMIPFFAVSLIGAIIGMGLAQKKPNKRIPLFIFLTGLVLLPIDIVMIILGALKGDYTFMYMGQAAQIFFVSLFGQLSILSLCLWLIEFKGKTGRFVKISRFWRRYGAISLTIFSFEIIAVIPRYFVQAITGWHVASQAVEGPFDAKLWQAAITIAFVMIFWEGLIRLWEQVNFVGTFEWVNAKLLSIGQKIPATSKREIKDIIYNIQPITFVQ
ncbi:MAG: DUF1624 domain-containing protein [Candidatus Heimdallarchaeota archaeon]|nr:MAG: DUF1624 domain-containing protein [Candidatus Heimdallarchaeota archaeon]